VKYQTTLGGLVDSGTLSEVNTYSMVQVGGEESLVGGRGVYSQ